MRKFIIVIPTFNESDNLPKITQALFDLAIPQMEILIVDDDSPDGTGMIADQLAEKHHGRFHVIHRKGKLGLGTAYIEGFKWALNYGADYIIQMDADFSHSPIYIPEFLTKIKDCDIVVGSRYVKGGSVDKRWSIWRWFLSWWANSIWVRLILWTKTKDATAGFKCWQSSALKEIGLDRIKSNGYIFQVEMCYVAEHLGMNILEIPIYFEDRRIGQSKMNMRVKFEAATRVFEIRNRHKHVQPIT